MKYLLVTAAASLVSLSACAPMTSHRGTVQQEDMAQKITVGESKEQVLQQFGSPSSRSGFGEETWYYIQASKQQAAFFKPEITDQQVLAVIFAADGTVKELKQYGLQDRQQVAIIDETTPTEGHSIGFFEQVLGNIGRFNETPAREVNPRGPAGRR